MSGVRYYESYIPDQLEAKFLKFKSKLAGVTYNGSYKRPTYAMVFDYFIREGIFAMVSVDGEKSDGRWTYSYDSYVGKDENGSLIQYDFTQGFPSWHEAANAAIEKAIELIEENVAGKNTCEEIRN